MRLRYCFFVLAALCFAGRPAPSLASGWLQLAPDPDANQCCIADPGPNQVVTVYVVAKYMTGGVTGFRFAAPLPATSGLIHIADQSSFVLVGDSQTDVTIGLGLCETGSFVAMEMLCFRPATIGPRVFYPVAPGAIYADCYFAEYPLNTIGVMVNAVEPCEWAEKVSPANGAIEVPLTTSLSWSPGYSCILGDGGSVLYFGTTPDPPAVAYDVGSPYAVGPLEPETTYYWNILDPSSGPVWSFTTTKAAAVQASTWGSIKALYR